MGIRLSQLVKNFDEPPTQVLRGIDLEVQAGEFVALTGRSGSGKSTLLYLMSSLDTPTSGTVEIDGEDIQQISQVQLHQFRNQHMGFVFQSYYLLPELSALENVLMPTVKVGQQKHLFQQARQLLVDFGLEHRMDRLPRQLSGGEQQRVVIARAMIMNPRYLFADEPTGNLDSVNSQMVMEILERMNRERKTTLILVTHDVGYATHAQRQIQLSDGRVIQDTLNPSKT